MYVNVTPAYRADGSCVYVGSVRNSEGCVVAEVTRENEDAAYAAAFAAALDCDLTPGAAAVDTQVR